MNLRRGLRQFPPDAVKPPPVPHDANPSDECPDSAEPDIVVHVGTWRASEILDPRQLTYNERFAIRDPDAIVFVEHNPRFNGPSTTYPRRADILADLRHTYGPMGRKPLEPLILRAPPGPAPAHASKTTCRRT